MTPLRMLSTDEKHAEIKRLYYSTTRQTIQEDLAKALDILKSMASEEERERATVYMDGMAQMRLEWARAGKKKDRGQGKAQRGKRKQGNAKGKT